MAEGYDEAVSCVRTYAGDMGMRDETVWSGIGRKREARKQKYTNAPSPSIIASLSLEMEKSPSVLTAVTFGSDGTVKCFPGRNAWWQILDSFSSVCKLETIRGAF